MDKKFRIEIKGKISNRNAQTIAKKFGMSTASDGKFQILKADVNEKACDDFVALFNSIKPAGCWIEADEIHDDGDENPFAFDEELDGKPISNIKCNRPILSSSDF
jgi:hypothetical protein